MAMAKHVYRCPLRWSDMDAFGHVNNVAYFRYLEEARVDLVFRLAPQHEGMELSQGSVVTRQEIRYLQTMPYRADPVIIETRVLGIKAAALTFASVIRDADHVYAEGSTGLAPFDLAAGRPRRITKKEREFFEQYLESADSRERL
jgi:acyl-CoA thioester hydrolase